MLPEIWNRRVRGRLADIEAGGLRRRLRVAGGPCAPRRQIDDRDCLSFASNDYLGLARDPRIATALSRAASRWGVGAGAAQLLGGCTTVHRALEERLADWVGMPRALLFSTGYQANLALVTALVGRGDLVVQDRLDHASLIDGAHLSGATLRRYPHADPGGLSRHLKRDPDAHRLVVTDSVFSMDGDIAPLAQLATISREHQALFAVDDAHGLGVIGKHGRGAAADSGCRADLVMATLGKAVGTFGAFVAGGQDLIELLLQTARSYIYTTAPPPALAAASLEAVRLARSEDGRREKLAGLIARLRAGASDLGIELAASSTPIQPLLLGLPERATAISAALEERGIWAPAIRPPTVPPESARLRISLSAAHEPEDIDRLLGALEEVL